MNTLVNFLWTGFGTGATAARAVGIALICLLSVVIVGYYLLRWLYRLAFRPTPAANAD